MYLVLDLTNGDGYSDPTIHLFNKRNEAYKKFAECIGWNIINMSILEEDSTDTKKLFSDGEDNFGTHIIELDDKKHHVVNIEGNFVDEINVTSYSNLNHARGRLEELNAYIHDVERSSREGMVICGGETGAGHETNLLIYKRKDK